MVIQELYTEKLRPKKLNQLILPKRIRAVFENGQITQNFLFTGSPGLGKTTLAKVLAEPHTDLYINTSDERSVDVIRDKITNFCSTMSILNGESSLKVVILDEMDGAGDQFFKALRATMEKFTNVRFIATCNYINKIPDPLQSRFQVINFDFLDREEESEIKLQYIDRVGVIFGKLNIACTPDAVLEFVNRNFPDMRTIINKMQYFKTIGLTQITTEDIKKASWSFEDIYQLIISKPDPQKNYQFLVSNYSTMVDDILAALGKEFIDWIQENHKTKINKIPDVLIEVAHYQSQRHLVIDGIVSLLACVFKLQITFNS